MREGILTEGVTMNQVEDADALCFYLDVALRRARGRLLCVASIGVIVAMLLSASSTGDIGGEWSGHEDCGEGLMNADGIFGRGQFGGGAEGGPMVRPFRLLRRDMTRDEGRLGIISAIDGFDGREAVIGLDLTPAGATGAAGR
jgi:hypothetical protein